MSTMHHLLVIRALVVTGVLVTTGGLGRCQTPSVREVLSRFCELDAQGEQLRPGGWKKLAALFVSPGAPPAGTITVVRDFVVSRPAFGNSTAQFYVEYIELGRIDPVKVAFSSPRPSGIKVRAGFELAKNRAAEWRILGPVPEPHLTVYAAIRYATEMRASASDIAVRKNADKTLAALRRLR